MAREAGKALVIEEVRVAAPKANEVRIKIVCTSLCHSDITLWSLKVSIILYSLILIIPIIPIPLNYINPFKHPR